MIMGISLIVGDVTAILGNEGLFGGPHEFRKTHRFKKACGQFSNLMDDYHKYGIFLIRYGFDN
jgi:hypothetical protein